MSALTDLQKNLANDPVIVVGATVYYYENKDLDKGPFMRKPAIYPLPTNALFVTDTAEEQGILLTNSNAEEQLGKEMNLGTFVRLPNPAETQFIRLWLGQLAKDGAEGLPSLEKSLTIWVADRPSGEFD